MTGPEDVFTPGPPLPPRSHDRVWLALIWLGSLIAVLLLVLIVLLLTDDDEPGIAADSSITPTSETPPATAGAATTAAPVTTAAPPTTAAPITTAAPVTTTAPSTTAAPTTTAPPFPGDTGDKTCTEPLTNAMKVSDIQFAQFDGFTRIIFFADNGAVAPGCFAGYRDPTTLEVMFFPVSVLDPFVAGIFDAGGYLNIGLGSVLGVDAGGQGGGSGEWFFVVDVTGTRAFTIVALSAPSRLIIDIAD